MTFLLDVNILIALVDREHIDHADAHQWFGREGSRSWATCPITENGLIRIVGNPRYINSLGSPATVAQTLIALRSLKGHEFWSDDLCPVSSPLIDPAQILTPGQVTDTYLLALAVSRGGRFATFDRRLSSKAVKGGANALYVIQPSNLH